MSLRSDTMSFWFLDYIGGNVIMTELQAPVESLRQNCIQNYPAGTACKSYWL